MSCWPLTLGFHDALGADSYRLKFDNTPPPSFTRKNKSVLQNQDFCSQGAFRFETGASRGCLILQSGELCGAGVVVALCVSEMLVFKKKKKNGKN